MRLANHHQSTTTVHLATLVPHIDRIFDLLFRLMNEDQFQLFTSILVSSVCLLGFTPG